MAFSLDIVASRKMNLIKLFEFPRRSIFTVAKRKGIEHPILILQYLVLIIWEK